MTQPARVHAPQSSPSEPSRERHFHRVTDINPVIGEIIALMSAADYSEKDQFAVRLSLEEAMVNAVKHGNGEDPRKKVVISFQVSPDLCTIRIEDEGPGFRPEGIPDPLAPENLERPGGRGVFLMRHYMTTVHFNERGNCVMLAKKKSK